MALFFGQDSDASTRIDLGSSTLLTGTSNPLTIVAWIRNDWDSAGVTFQNIVRAGNNECNFLFINDVSPPGLLYERQSGGAWPAADANPSGFLSNDGSTWNCVAVVDGDDGTNILLYSGTESAAVAEPGAYGSQSAPNGNRDNSAQTVYIGNYVESPAECFPGDIAFVAVFRAKLTQAQLRAIQWNPITESLRHSSLAGMWVPGMHGVSNVPDLSGNGVDGTVGGTAPTVSENPKFVRGFPKIGGPRPVSISSGAASQGITGSTYTDADTFGTGTISLTYAIGGVSYVDPDTFGSGTISASYTITGAAYSDPDTLGSGTISTLYTISGVTYADPDTFGSGSVALGAGPQTVTGSTFTDPDTFGAGQVGLNVNGSSFADPDTFGTGTISITISGSAFVDPDQFGSGSISYDQTITGVLFADPDTFGNGSVSVGTSPQTVTGSIYVDPDTFGVGQLDLILRGVTTTDADSFGAGQIDFGLTGSLYNDPDAFGAGTISMTGQSARRVAPAVTSANSITVPLARGVTLGQSLRTVTVSRG